jgi:hypothetical protein
MRRAFSNRSAGILATAAVLSLLLAAPQRVEGQVGIRFTQTVYPANQGATVTVPFEVFSDAAVSGFSFGVRHDATKLTLAGAGPSPNLLPLLESGPSPNFLVVDIEPDGGPGFYVAALLGPESTDPPVRLPAGTHTVFEARYTVGIEAEDTATLAITGTLGASAGGPRVALVVDVEGGRAQSFAPSQAIVEIAAVTTFVRGDADASGRQNITDAVAILSFLFLGSGQANRDCLVALNVDGQTPFGNPTVEDRQDITLSDAVFFLNGLFRGGPPPAAPFPDCGISALPVSSEIECTRSACSP